jgi:hypothetical protein
MPRPRISAVIVLCIGALAAPTGAGAAKGPKGSDADLWATINACNPPNTPGAVGIRGSMPGDGVAKQKMFMRLQVQFQGPKGAWRFLGTGGDSGWLPMGSAKPRSKQGGQTFAIAPTGKTTTVRGYVTFQWRAPNGTIVRSAKRLTTAGRVSSAGADPAGFSAATCTF